MPLAYAMTRSIGFDNFYTSSDTFIAPIEEVKFISILKVRRGVVEIINSSNGKYDVYSLQLSSSTISVQTNSTTSYVFGDGSTADRSDVDEYIKIYVSGYMKSDESAMIASKVIIANKSVLSRKN